MAAVPPAAPPAPPLAGTPAVLDALATCGLDAAQRGAIVAEGFTTLSEFGRMRNKDLAQMVRRITSLPVARGGVRIGQVQLRKMEALVYWVKDRRRRSQDLVVEDFTEATLEDCLDKMDLEERESEEADAAKAVSPGKLQSGTGWVQWEIAFVNYLSGIKGIAGIPLNYVVRKDLPAGHTFVSDEERLVYEAPLVGNTFTSDSKKVFCLLKEVVLGTDGWEWIKEYDDRKDGRISMQKLREHYDGPAAVKKSLAFAQQQIKKLHYRNEQAFFF